MSEISADQTAPHNDSHSGIHESERREKPFDLERGRKFGDFYKSFIHGELNGAHIADTSVIANQEDKILVQNMIETVALGFRTQAAYFESGQMSAKDI
jgi:hypothetical protein